MRALAFDETHAPSLLALAHLALAGGDAEGCRVRCAALLRAEPDNEEAAIMLAELMAHEVMSPKPNGFVGATLEIGEAGRCARWSRNGYSEERSACTRRRGGREDGQRCDPCCAPWYHRSSTVMPSCSTSSCWRPSPATTQRLRHCCSCCGAPAGCWTTGHRRWRRRRRQRGPGLQRSPGWPTAGACMRGGVWEAEPPGFRVFTAGACVRGGGWEAESSGFRVFTAGACVRGRGGGT
jgi:hypothetical protein